MDCIIDVLRLGEISENGDGIMPAGVRIINSTNSRAVVAPLRTVAAPTLSSTCSTRPMTMCVGSHRPILHRWRTMASSLRFD